MREYLVLTPDIPDGEADVLVFHSLHIETQPRIVNSNHSHNTVKHENSSKLERLTNGWNRGDDLAKLELVQDGGLTSSVETNHEDTHLFLCKESAEQLPERQPHLFQTLFVRLLTNMQYYPLAPHQLTKKKSSFDCFLRRILSDLIR